MYVVHVNESEHIYDLNKMKMANTTLEKEFTMHSYSAYIKTILYASSVSILAVSFMIFPKEAYEASVRGLSMWWDVVFPSLLPFFIISEFLIRYGVVSFIGALFEPIMRPLFRVPGSGGFVWAMGLASGFPAGAKLTARLRQENKITAIEGERLVSFSNASNPLFIFGAIAVGFFHNPALGVVLAASHYGGNLLVGLAMRFYGRKEELRSRNKKRFSLSYAIASMHKERLKDQRPIGKLMGDAIQSAIQTLLMIGGFIILFSVLNQILALIHISAIFSFFITMLLGLIQMPDELSTPIVSGLFEITLGSQLISNTIQTSLYEQVIITSFILAFNGFSVQAQVASILAETDIRFKPFFLGRCLHGLFAAGLAALLFERLYQEDGGDSTVFLPLMKGESFSSSMIQLYEWFLHWGGYITLSSLIIYICYTSYQALNSTTLSR